MSRIAQKKTKKNSSTEGDGGGSHQGFEGTLWFFSACDKEYVVAYYKVGSDKLSPAINRYLKTAVASGEMVQTKGKAVSCSFKLPADQARSWRAASSGEREQKNHVAKTKAMLAIKAALQLTSKNKKWISPAKPKNCLSKAKKAP